jgi:hypothetical protein
MALVRTDTSEESITSIIRVKRISELGMLAVTSNSETTVLTRATWHHVLEGGILLKRKHL